MTLIQVLDIALILFMAFCIYKMGYWSGVAKGYLETKLYQDRAIESWLRASKVD